MNGPIGGWESPGELTYNGVGAGSWHKLKTFKVAPVEDQAGRTTAYNRVSLAFEWYIAFDQRGAVGRSQNYLEFLLRSLNKPGGYFKWDRRGVGLMEVNRPGTGGVRDVAWGPKTRAIGLELLGAGASDSAGDRASWKVDFEVELAIPLCANATYQFAPMEYGYEVGYHIENGLTTRTVNGYIRIPTTRATVDSRAIPDVADRWREQVVPARLVGYKRLPMDFRSGYDKSRMEFQVIDQQLPGPPPPPGILEWDASESLRTSTMALKQWTGSIDARYTVAPGCDPVQSQRHFLSLAADRLTVLRRSAGVLDGKVFITGLQIGNPSLSGLGQFSAVLHFRVNAATLTDFLAGHGLWKPLPNTGGWAAWDRSMGAVYSPRGLSGLYLSPREDAIVDLCGPTPRTGPPTASPPPPEATNTLRGPIFTPPTPLESWLRYEAWLTLETDSGTNVLRTMPSGLPTTRTAAPPPAALTEDELRQLFGQRGNKGSLFTLTGGILDNQMSPPPPPSSPPPPTGGSGRLINEPQVTTTPRAAAIITLYLNVRALRVAFPVPCPTLYDWNGNPLVPDMRLGETAWVQKMVGTLGDGQPLFGAWGRIRYTLPSDVAAQITLDDLIMFNPFYGN
jgi:hypothetical protein